MQVSQKVAQMADGNLQTSPAHCRRSPFNVRVDVSNRDRGQVLLSASLCEPFEETPSLSTSARSNRPGQAAQVSHPAVVVADELIAKSFSLTLRNRRNR